MVQQTKTGFQVIVNAQPAPGQSGDFYGVNPRAVALAGPGQFVAPASGLTVGRFCWADPDTGEVSQSYVAGYLLAFVHRDNQAVIVELLDPATYSVNPGFPVTLFMQGDFWTTLGDDGVAGMNIYADPSSGLAIPGDTAPTTDSFTASAGFSGTAAMGASFTGVIATNVLTVSALTGYLTAGDIVAGVGVTPGTVLGAQLTGTPGAAGTYSITHADLASVAMTTTSTVLVVSAVSRGGLTVGSIVTGGGIAALATVTAIISGTGGVGRYTLSGAAQSSASGTKLSVNDSLDVTAVSLGEIAPGDVLAGTGVTAGTQIVAQLSGTDGGVGVYQISIAQTFASTTVTVGAIATPWKLASSADAGEVGKISTW